MELEEMILIQGMNQLLKRFSLIHTYTTKWFSSLEEVSKEYCRINSLKEFNCMNTEKKFLHCQMQFLLIEGINHLCFTFLTKSCNLDSLILTI
ncbi:CLUMA_CG006006, isoform A [Clunio marinus]|uniref:CLUMA_CG006006, isoform A n=1 Tax=Clunio marinus TaxID=568069 RepID=A0A1J1HWG1_9DIPT|nr:CLUMA_CG006006, isoform A [Clunio marinus]